MLRIALALALASPAFAQAPSNAQEFLSGLVTMEPANQRPVLFLDADGVLDPIDVPAFVRRMRANPVADGNARLLTTRLRARGEIAANEEIIGVSDGRALKFRAPLTLSGR